MNGYKRDYGLEKKFFQHRDLREMLRWCSEQYADKTAFITKLRNKESKEPIYIKTTYSAMFMQMNQLGTALVERGMKGMRIGVIGENSYRWVLAYVTAANGVGVTVPLDALLQEEELLSCIERADIRCLIFDKKHEELIRKIAESGKTGITLFVMTNIDKPKPEGEGFLHMDELLEEGKALIDQ